MKLLSLDLETTGLDLETCEPLELGFALYDTEVSKDTPVIMESILTIPKAEITEEITSITGINQAMIDKYAVSIEDAFLALINCMNQFKPDALVGHNILGYDLPIIARYTAIMKDVAPVEETPPVIDTRIDLPHKRQPKNNSLIFLSADIVKFCNPFSHRALFDCLATMKLLFHFDAQAIYESANSPLVMIRADVSFSGKDLAKAQGYNWNGEQKIWEKLIRLSKLAEEKQKCTFPVLVLDQQRKITL